MAISPSEARDLTLLDWLTIRKYEDYIDKCLADGTESSYSLGIDFVISWPSALAVDPTDRLPELNDKILKELVRRYRESGWKILESSHDGLVLAPLSIPRPSGHQVLVPANRDYGREIRWIQEYLSHRAKIPYSDGQVLAKIFDVGINTMRRSISNTEWARKNRFADQK